MNQNTLAEILDKVHINLGRHGHGKYADGTLITTSFHDFDIWYTLCGSFSLNINGREYIAQAGDAFLMTPGTTLTLRSSGYAEQLFCHFVPQYAGGRTLQGSFYDYLIPAAHVNLLRALSNYLMQLAGESNVVNIAVKSILKVLLCEMLLSSTRNSEQFLSAGTLPNLDNLSRILEFIHQNLHLNITNRELSSLVGYNESYFSRYFKKHMGISPKQYILKAKMDLAKSLLVDNGLSVKETAIKIGFSDQFSFSKQFKSLFGTTPSSYKKIET